MSQLPTAVLGMTGLEVTRLGYGAGHRREISDEHCESILNAVLDSGINYIDTADDYGNSEELLGKYIGHRRSEYYLATKCGGPPSGERHVWTRENVFRNLHESLRRLGVDCLDVIQLHSAPVDACVEHGLVESLRDMRSQGKVRWIGASTNLPHLPTMLEWGVFDLFQIPYSALERDHEDWVTRTADAGAGVVINSGAALGEPGAGLGAKDLWRRFDEAGLDELRQDGESRTAFVVRFTLSHPDAHTNIVETTNHDHLRENVQAILAGPLPNDVYAEARRRLDAVGSSRRATP